MKLIDETISTIKALGGCNAAYTMTHVLQSACDHRKVHAPSFLEMSATLDDGNLDLVQRLIKITSEPDYSNDAQAEALNWLEQSRFAEYLDKTIKVEHG